MTLGLLSIETYLPSAHSLKDKRSILRKVIDRIRHRHNVCIAEVGNNDLWQRASLAVCMVANDSAFVDSVLSKILREIENNLDGEIVDYTIDLSR
ncbi:MAG: DUF503 domain-containing protein [Candidatus Zixiibacteriota bacterium]